MGIVQVDGTLALSLVLKKNWHRLILAKCHGQLVLGDGCLQPSCLRITEYCHPFLGRLRQVRSILSLQYLALFQ